ncbi:MAG: hypothetical protein PHS49_07190 [Candidatus Gracilibacteria bacterium]|nr:hypothetical protein [Candidatus Gracilibacteria bacterium]
MLFNKFDEYYQRLLVAQYDISEMIEHKLTRGEVREDFLKTIILDQFPSLQILSGIITNDKVQSPQTDIIITDYNCRTRKLGTKNLVNIDDCKMILEVKSNATGKDLKKFNDDAGKIKSLGNENLLCGIFCYKIDLKLNTILERFGYKYFSEYQTFQDYDKILLKYPNINFFISIDSFPEFEDDKEVFIVFDKEKEIDKNTHEKGGYSFIIDKPSVKNLFNVLSGFNR